ncbi:MAG: flavodoxin domain-containing protein [Ilumatobacteraceae bacterium]
MQVLIAYGSKHGSTAGLAHMIGDALELRDIHAEVRDANSAGSVDSYDGVIVAGALYANRWHRHARRFVRRNARALRNRPVWLISSGPLDDSARSGELKPVAQVSKLAASIGASGQVTFGGRLAGDAKGFIAGKMAKNRAGDWRDADQVSEFAAVVAAGLSRIESMKA